MLLANAGFIDGKVIMDDRKMATVNEQAITQTGQRFAEADAIKAFEYYKGLPSSEVLDQQEYYKN